jgi:small subunit ribosomal protein S16
MPVKIRLARSGAKKRPHYRVVVTDSRSPRDGNFIEKIGTYHPLLKTTDKATRIQFKNSRVEYWLSQGAQPTERVTKFIHEAGLKLPNTILKKMSIKEQNRVKKLPKKESKSRVS